MRLYFSCSSNDSVLLKYRTLACDIADVLAKRGHKLVFDGSDTGMSGKCYMAFKYEGAKTKAVVDLTKAPDLEKLEVDAYDVYPSTMSRIEGTFKSSEVIVILPGGLQTLAEFFTFIEEIRVRKTKNVKVILFNYEHFYSPLINFLKNLYNEKFISAQELKMFDIVTDINSLDLYLRRLKGKEEK